MTSTELKNRVVKYCNRVLNGKINACKKHKQACSRFLNDIREDSNYYLDIEELRLVNLWSSYFTYSKGVLKGKNIELTDFQLFIIVNILCIKDKVNNYRKYKKAYIQLGRKNGKTQLISIIASYFLFVVKEQQEIYITGWGLSQSEICFREVARLIKTNKYLDGSYYATRDKLTNKKIGSIVEPLSLGAINTGDGKDVSLAIIDEYHCHKTDEILNVLEGGMIARTEPLTLIITTAGFDLYSPCHKEYEYSGMLLSGSIHNDEYFSLICELEKDDDVKDEKNWIKANPLLATYEEGINNIRTFLRESLDKPENMRNYLTKHMNKWVQIGTSNNTYLDIDKWSRCAKDINLEYLRGYKVWIGIDLSSTIDLTSIGIIGVKDDKFFILNHNFSPLEYIDEKIKIEKKPYDLWEKQGYITLTSGYTVDYRVLIRYIQKIEQEYGLEIQEICYDPWNASILARDLNDLGYNTVEIRQGIRTLGEATKTFREKVYNLEIIHANNPILNFAVLNAITISDTNGNFKLDKRKAKERIDPLASVINAFVRAMYSQNEKELIFDIWKFD